MHLSRRSATLGTAIGAAIALVAVLFYVVHLQQRPVLSPAPSQFVRTAEYIPLPEPSLQPFSGYLFVPTTNVPTAPLIPSSEALPDRLVVTRPKGDLDPLPPVLAQLSDGPYRVDTNSIPPPFTKTITDQTTVQKLYSDIYALPPIEYQSGAPISCPLDTGISYWLDFYKGNRFLLHAADYPTGCGGVSLGKGDNRAGTDYFDGQLEKALGLSMTEFLGL
jgi:hypothetical protein